MEQAGQSATEFVESVAAQGKRIETPCGESGMVWHVWGQGGPPLVLLHGGYGSWTHWIRNVLPLSQRFTVYAADTPGLGDSAEAPDPVSPESLAAIIAAGIQQMLPGGDRFHLAGFSFGGLLGGHVAAQLGHRLRGFVLVGASGTGLKRDPTPLDRVPAGATEAERLAIARGNLASLMFADLANIDDIAVHLQASNAGRARVKSRAFGRSDSLAQQLPKIKTRIDGIWGERDATAYPHMEQRITLLRSIQPETRFEIIPGAGHWVMYEAAERFNPLLISMLG